MSKKQQQPMNPTEYLMTAVLVFLGAFVATGSLAAALMWATFIELTIVFIMAERLTAPRTAVWQALVAGFDWLLALLRWERKVKLVWGELALGTDIKKRRWAHRLITQLQGASIWGVTGGGKTTFIHSIVYFIIKYYLDKQFIQLAFIDLKVGAVDFSAYSRLNLLFRPLATSIEEADQLILHILQEIERRAQLYRLVAGGDYVRICNDIDRYHDLKRKLHLTNLPDLPYIMFFIDEVSQFTRNSKHLHRLVTIAEQGRAFGIYPWVCTQYPTKESLPPVLRQQLPTRFVFPMAPSALKVAEVYESTMPDHQVNEHECYASLGTSGRSYIALRTNVVPYDEFEAMVNARSGDGLAWDDLAPIEDEFELDEADLRDDWNGISDDQKRESLYVWFGSFHERPSVDDFLAKYNASERTYYNWVPKLWGERFGHPTAINPDAIPNEA